ncbi:MAG: dTMP kinase [Candidatus Hydrogenedentota bacterium]|nr:MAG: dTMP kinase [Candidatus Hydrogenedentota bacterium]
MVLRGKRKKKGLLITFEGPDGSGKTTHARRLVRKLRRQGWEVVLTREPGGTPFGDRVRKILLDRKFEEEIGARTELLLYEAIRAHHVKNVIAPAIANGEIVVCDRFTDASVAYQGWGRRLGEKEVKAINAFATGGITPDLTILLDLKPEVGLGVIETRRNGGKDGLDRVEAAGITFHRRVRRGYRSLARKERNRIVMIRRAEDPEETFKKIEDAVETFLKRKGAGVSGVGKEPRRRRRVAGMKMPRKR